jgi:hypothetical protein
VNFRRPRVKNGGHLDFVRSLPCVICGDDTSTEATHVRMSCIADGKRSTGMAEKPSDWWAVPLCGKHHREQHAMNERAFWKVFNVDPIRVAAFLYLAGLSDDHQAGLDIIGAHGHFDASLSDFG